LNVVVGADDSVVRLEMQVLKDGHPTWKCASSIVPYPQTNERFSCTQGRGWYAGPGVYQVSAGARTASSEAQSGSAFVEASGAEAALDVDVSVGRRAPAGLEVAVRLRRLFALPAKVSLEPVGKTFDSPLTFVLRNGSDKEVFGVGDGAGYLLRFDGHEWRPEPGCRACGDRGVYARVPPGGQWQTSCRLKAARPRPGKYRYLVQAARTSDAPLARSGEPPTEEVARGEFFEFSYPFEVPAPQ
jgi:hypothetical protein